MKRLVTLMMAVLVVSACAPPATPTAAPFASAIQVGVTTNDFEVGQPRVPFVLFSGTEKVADARAVRITAYDLSSATPVPGWTGEATDFSDYEVPYWVAYPELPHAGNWGMELEIALADGSTVRSQFAIAVAEASQSPSLGERPPASANRTLKTEPDIHALSSSHEPEPGLYQLTVAEALASGRPTVVTFATPAFCASKLCAPVVNSVTEVFREYGNRANFLHVEVYKSFDPLVFADEMAEWGLTSEPWTFVLDREGIVAAKLGGPVSPRELIEALEPELE